MYRRAITGLGFDYRFGRLVCGFSRWRFYFRNVKNRTANQRGNVLESQHGWSPDRLHHHLRTAMKRVLLAFLFLLPLPAFADIAFDAASAGQDNGGTGALSFTHTSSGANRIGFVTILGDTIGGADDLSTVTWGGTAMTLIAKITTGPNRYQYLYYLVGQATGAQTIAVNSTTNHYLIACSTSYTGALQTSPVDISTTQVSGSSSAMTLTTSLTTMTAN